MQLPGWNNCKNPRTRGKTAQPSISHSGQGLEGKKSSSLPVEGGIFSLTFPFIDQAFALIDPVSAKAIYRQLSRNFAPNKAHVSNRSACDDGQSQVQTVRPGQSGRQSSVRSNCHTRRIGECIVFRIRQVVGGGGGCPTGIMVPASLTVYCLPASGFMTV